MWLYLSLITAFLSAISVILNKKLVSQLSPVLLTWTTLVIATPVILLYALRQPTPQINQLFILGVAGSVVLYALSKIIGLSAIKLARLSDIYPLISLGPIFTLLFAIFPPLSEIPSRQALLGAILVLSGVYLLNLKTVRTGLLAPFGNLIRSKASRIFVLAVCIDSLVIIFDKLAINQTYPHNPTFTLLIENMLVILGLLPYILIHHRQYVLPLKHNSWTLLIIGLINAISTIMAFTAVGSASVGLVATILKTQVLVVILLSYLIFRDKPKPETILGSLIMMTGVVIINTAP